MYWTGAEGCQMVLLGEPDRSGRVPRVPETKDVRAP
jgi:hypothetical protein